MRPTASALMNCDLTDRLKLSSVLVLVVLRSIV